MVTNRQASLAFFFLLASSALGACSDSPRSDLMAPVAPTPRFNPRVSIGAAATSTLLVDTGPGLSQSVANGLAIFDDTSGPFPYLSFLAGQFTLSDAVTLDRVAGWIYSIHAGTIDVRIRADVGGLPGASLYSKNYSVGTNTEADWVSFSDFNASLAAGTYWLSFEPTASGGYFGSFIRGAPSPLSKYAYFAGPNNRWWQVIYGDNSAVDIGMRVYGLADPSAMIGDARALLASLLLPKGIANSFDVKLKAALVAIDSGNTATACSSLQDLVKALKAMSGKKINAADAEALTSSVNVIRAALGC